MASEQTLSMFGSALNEIASGPMVSEHAALTEALLRRLSEKGVTLDECCDRRVMKRSRSTLEDYCKRFQIAFPDFTPPNMRKQVSFRRRGDFYELKGSQVHDVAKALDITVTNRDGQDECAVPVHAYPDAKKALRAAGYTARVIKGKAA